MPQSTPKSAARIASDGSAISAARPRLAVTTARRAQGRIDRAAAVATQIDATLLERQSFSTTALLDAADVDLLYVVGTAREWVQDREERRCFVHEGRFVERAKREPRVPLLRAVGEVACVVDGTCGLGQDALLMASVVPRVIAYEVSPVVFCLLEAGFSQMAARDDVVGQAARRVDLRPGDVLAERSVWRREEPGVLLLDPMWARSHPGADHMALLGRVAQRSGFDAAALDTLGAAVPRLVMKVPPHQRGDHGRWTSRVQSTRAAYLVADRR